MIHALFHKVKVGGATPTKPCMSVKSSQNKAPRAAKTIGPTMTIAKHTAISRPKENRAIHCPA